MQNKITMMKKIISFIAMMLCILMTGFAQDKPSGLREGTEAPLFAGKDQSGNKISLAEKLKKGPVVVMFYRGAWCPYCNKQLSQLQDSLQMLTDRGASVIAITPETEANVEKTIDKTGASFSIISDEGLKIMDAYGVTFELDRKTNTKYKVFGINLEKANGANGRNLPVPATYVINQEGIITYAFFDPDYKKRATVKEMLRHL